MFSFYLVFQNVIFAVSQNARYCSSFFTKLNVGLLFFFVLCLLASAYTMTIVLVLYWTALFTIQIAAIARNITFLPQLSVTALPPCYCCYTQLSRTKLLPAPQRAYSPESQFIVKQTSIYCWYNYIMFSLLHENSSRNSKYMTGISCIQILKLLKKVSNFLIVQINYLVNHLVHN